MNILLISLIHLLLINRLEKIISKSLFNFSTIKRPNSCNIFDVKCVGMPSGHAESITILALLLYYKNYISFSTAMLLILIVSYQRISSKMHSINQILVGILLGILYSFIYIKFGI